MNLDPTQWLLMIIFVATGVGMVWFAIISEQMRRSWERQYKQQFINSHVKTLRAIGVSEDEIESFVRSCDKRTDYFNFRPSQLIQARIDYIKATEGDEGLMRAIRALIHDHEDPSNRRF